MTIIALGQGRWVSLETGTLMTYNEDGDQVFTIEVPEPGDVIEFYNNDAELIVDCLDFATMSPEEFELLDFDEFDDDWDFE